MGSLALGFSLGFLVAAQIGPISLLVMRTVLRGALATGIAGSGLVAFGGVLGWKTLGDDGR